MFCFTNIWTEILIYYLGFYFYTIVICHCTFAKRFQNFQLPSWSWNFVKICSWFFLSLKHCYTSKIFLVLSDCTFQRKKLRNFVTACIMIEQSSTSRSKIQWKMKVHKGRGKHGFFCWTGQIGSAPRLFFKRRLSEATYFRRHFSDKS